MQNDNIIEFQNVSYRYEADDGEEKLPLVVNNISLNFKNSNVLFSIEYRCIYGLSLF